MSVCVRELSMLKEIFVLQHYKIIFKKDWSLNVRS
jgi:hypothetical protein